MSNLLNHLKQVKNLSGAIPSAPQGLLDMKAALESMPIDVNLPAMSALVQVENLVTGVVDLVKNLGSMAAVGEFKNILAKIAPELGTTDITKVDPEVLAQAIRRAVPLDELEKAVGQATSLTASLSGLLGRKK